MAVDTLAEDDTIDTDDSSNNDDSRPEDPLARIKSDSGITRHLPENKVRVRVHTVKDQQPPASFFNNIGTGAQR